MKRRRRRTSLRQKVDLKRVEPLRLGILNGRAERGGICLRVGCLRLGNGIDRAKLCENLYCGGRTLRFPTASGSKLGLMLVAEDSVAVLTSGFETMDHA